MDLKLVDAIFSRISSAFAFLETAEKREVVRCLRDIYFYPDELLSLLDRIIKSDGADVDYAVQEGFKYLPKYELAERALKFITSPSVTTNLKLILEMVEELRSIANFKSGVRGRFNGIFFLWFFNINKDEIVELAKAAKADVEILNDKIRNLEQQLTLPQREA